ncbi:unnamed protein product, partial [Ectocarpus sp. 4 AP-2014]
AQPTPFSAGNSGRHRFHLPREVRARRQKTSVSEGFARRSGKRRHSEGRCRCELRLRQACQRLRREGE